MIPKIIHYCWFGDGELSEQAKNCIATWKKYLSDYEIIEWNEKNFDINCCDYVKEAYGCKKYAFVSDYARLYALYHYGGIYFDTDVEVKKNIDKFLSKKEVFGFESSNRIGTAIVMAEKQSSLIKEWLDTYADRHFLSGDKMNMQTNVFYLTNMLKNKGARLTGERQELLDGDVLICETEVFYPYSIGESKKKDFSSSYTIHWCDGSWVSGKELIKHNLIKLTKKVLGANNYYKIKDMIQKRVE